MARVYYVSWHTKQHGGWSVQGLEVEAQTREQVKGKIEDDIFCTVADIAEENLPGTEFYITIRNRKRELLDIHLATWQGDRFDGELVYEQPKRAPVERRHS